MIWRCVFVGLCFEVIFVKLWGFLKMGLESWKSWMKFLIGIF